MLVADGGSVDDTREENEELKKSPWIERVLSIYHGIPGKGSTVRQIFEVANLLRSEVCVLFDSDFQSINAGFVQRMGRDLDNSYDFISPFNTRYKYEGTLTKILLITHTILASVEMKKIEAEDNYFRFKVIHMRERL